MGKTAVKRKATPVPVQPVPEEPPSPRNNRATQREQSIALQQHKGKQQQTKLTHGGRKSARQGGDAAKVQAFFLQSAINAKKLETAVRLYCYTCSNNRDGKQRVYLFVFRVNKKKRTPHS
jgi:hypothetical protein